MKTSLENSHEDIDGIAQQMGEGEVEDASEARHISKSRAEIRNQLEGFDLFTEEDIKKWEKKMESTEMTKLETEKLKNELLSEQRSIKKMVEYYSNTVDRHLTSAFTKESADEFKREFEKQSLGEKRIWYMKLDDEIKKRETLRKELLSTYPEITPEDEKNEVKEEIFKWRQHEMAEKVIEFRERRQNISKYTKKIQQDRPHFSDKSFKEFITSFMKLKTTDDQREWLAKYEEEAKKRRILSAQFKQFSIKRQQSCNEFWQLSRHEKIEYLEKMKLQLENDFKNTINQYTDKEVSPAIKQKYQTYFANINIQNKEYALENIKQWLENDQKYEKKYNDVSREIRDLPKYKREIWEKTPFDDKEQLLRDMNYEGELLREADNVLKKELKEKTITKNTMKIYRKKFLRAGIADKVVYLQQFENGMEKRREDVEKFNKLSKKTRSKFSNFWKGDRYAERHTILLKALEFELSQNKDTSKDNSEKIEKPESEKIPERIKEQIMLFHTQANSLETRGKIEQAIGIHKAVIMLDPNNKESLEKIKMLEEKIEKEETMENNKLFETLVAEAALENPVLEERENIEMAKKFIEDQEKVEHETHSSNIDNQQSHLNDEFEKNLDSVILSKNKQAKRLGKDGKLVDVEKIDAEGLGTGEESEKKHYKNLLRNKQSSDPLENVQIVDGHGLKKTVRYAKEKINKRERNLKNTLAAKTEKKAKKEGLEGDMKQHIKKATEEIDTSVDLAV